MILLRPLEEKDAIFMLEWMHDKDIQKAFKKNMLDASLPEVIRFCKHANKDDSICNGMDMHYAIVDERDEYLGTISLKSIDLINRNAEYAISTRKFVHGTGVAYDATQLILDKGFHKFELHRIYLSVLKDNKRAIQFYKKCGFIYEGEYRDCLWINGEYKSLEFFSMLNEDYIQR